MAAQDGPGVVVGARRAGEPVTDRVFRCLAYAAALYLTAALVRWAFGSRWSAYRSETLTILVAVVVSAAGCAWAGWRVRGTERRWRLLFALALSGAAFGQIVWTWYIFVDRLLVPRLSLMSIGFLAVPAIAVVALVAYPTTPVVRGPLAEPIADVRWRALAVFDAVLIVASLFILSWATALGSVVDLDVGSTREFAIAVAYPAGNIVLVVFVALLATLRRADNPRSLLFVGLGLLAYAVSESGFVYLPARVGGSVSPFANAGLIAGPLLIALGALAPASERREPGRRAGGEPSARTDRRARHALWGIVWLPYLPLLGICVLVAVQFATGDPIGVVEVCLALLVVVLVVVRQVFTLVENTLLFRRVQDAQRLLIAQARTDALTGVANRAHFSDRLDRVIARRETHRERLALLFCDLDDFKQVNDSLGHHVGDELLADLAARIRRCVRPRDTVARLGGDEFAVLVEGDGLDPTEVGARIVTELDQPFDIGGRAVRVRISVGLVVAEPDEDEVTAETLLRRGDSAMYEAKRRGKVRLARPEPADGHAGRVHSVLPDLEFALAGDRSAGVLDAHYQPVVSLTTGRTVAYEALARWTHPTRGAVPPDEFVPLAEDAGLVATLDSLMLDRACRDIAVLRAPGGDRAGGGPDAGRDLAVHVNISAVWAADPSIVDVVLAGLANHKIPSSALVLEITETYRIADLAAAASVMGRLTCRGIGLALDDVGAGYSSVAALHALPFSMVKLDTSLTGPRVPPKTVALRDGVVSLARALDLTVIAEGVETRGQANELAEVGCHLAQGFLYGSAASLEQVLGHLEPAPAP